jgi:hypothetical protein
MTYVVKGKFMVGAMAKNKGLDDTKKLVNGNLADRGAATVSFDKRCS